MSPKTGGVRRSVPRRVSGVLWGPRLRSLRKVSRECPQSVRDTFLTLRGHSRDTFRKLRSPVPKGPRRHGVGHSVGHPPFSGTLRGRSGTLRARRARETPVAEWGEFAILGMRVPRERLHTPPPPPPPIFGQKGCLRGRGGGVYSEAPRQDFYPPPPPPPPLFYTPPPPPGVCTCRGGGGGCMKVWPSSVETKLLCLCLPRTRGCIHTKNTPRATMNKNHIDRD